MLSVLQAQFKSYYKQRMQNLQHYRPFEPLEYTADAPKDVKETPLSPKAKYNADDFEQEPSVEQHIHGQQHGAFQQHRL
jgi:hypothetical protein